RGPDGAEEAEGDGHRQWRAARRCLQHARVAGDCSREERMTAQISYGGVQVGDELPAQTFRVRRANLVQYCGASGDFNVIHWNERAAKAVGLPNVIAHGMYTMAEAGRIVTDWAGDPGAVVEYGVRF